MVAHVPRGTETTGSGGGNSERLVLQRLLHSEPTARKGHRRRQPPTLGPYVGRTTEDHEDAFVGHLLAEQPRGLQCAQNQSSFHGWP